MDTDCFVRSEQRAQRTKLMRATLEGLRTTLGADELNHIRSSVIAAGIDIEGASKDNQDEIDNLVEKVMGELGDDGIRDEDESLSDAKDSSFFWTYFLAIPIIFTHGVATRMQFLYGSLYGRDGLHMSNGLAILAVGMTAAGRSTAPPLLLRNFQKPWVFVLLNATTLIGSTAMFLIPVVGGRDNFDENGLLKEGVPTSVATIVFYYFVMYIQGLAEVLSGWDVLMKFEMKKWSPDRQQLAFRASFVAIALGSSTAFYLSTALYESYGLYGCAYLGTVVGILNLLFPCFYLARRWGVFTSWRQDNVKERAKLCRKSGGLMKMLNLDEYEYKTERTTYWRRQSTQQLEFMKSSTTKSSEAIAEDEEKEGSVVVKNEEAEDKKYVHYVKPRNHFEYQEQLQHQTAERIVKNFLKLTRHNSASMGELKNSSQDLTREDILKAFNPSVLLTHSDHINLPAKFAKKNKTLKWFCILALALGSTMISSQFSVYTLFLVDVWNVSPVFAGTSMAIGELAGMLVLMLSILFEKTKSNRSDEDEKEEKGSNQGACGTLLKNPGLLLHVPSKFVVCCAVAVIPLALMGFVKPPAGIEDMDISISGVSSWPPGLIVALLSSIAIGVINCVMHATTIEMSALILLDDLFASAVAIGYSIRRIVNLSVALVATLLYSLNEFAVYQTVAFLYFLSVPVSVWILQFYVKCMPWQKRDVILDQSPEDQVTSDRFSVAVMNRKS